MDRRGRPCRGTLVSGARSGGRGRGADLRVAAGQRGGTREASIGGTAVAAICASEQSDTSASLPSRPLGSVRSTFASSWEPSRGPSLKSKGGRPRLGVGGRGLEARLVRQGAFARLAGRASGARADLEGVARCRVGTGGRAPGREVGFGDEAAAGRWGAKDGAPDRRPVRARHLEGQLRQVGEGGDEPVGRRIGFHLARELDDRPGGGSSTVA